MVQTFGTKCNGRYTVHVRLEPSEHCLRAPRDARDASSCSLAMSFDSLCRRSITIVDFSMCRACRAAGAPRSAHGTQIACCAWVVHGAVSGGVGLGPVGCLASVGRVYARVRVRRCACPAFTPVVHIDRYKSWAVVHVSVVSLATRNKVPTDF